MAPIHLMTPVNLMENGNTTHDIVTKKKKPHGALTPRFALADADEPWGPRVPAMAPRALSVCAAGEMPPMPDGRLGGV